MSRPKLIDLCCGAGGCSVGYYRAGWDVIGVDIEPHPDYPFFFIEADALDVLRGEVLSLDRIDAIHISPPCPRYSTATPAHTRDNHPDLIAPARELLKKIGKPYVIENVMGAPLENPTKLCGSMFNLPTRRHRLFETNFQVLQLACAHGWQKVVYGVYGQHGDKNGAVPRPNGRSRGVKARDAEHAGEVLGIDWMKKWSDLADAIPPAYTQYVGDYMQMALP